MPNTIQDDFRRATTRLNAVISASSPKLKRADAKKAEWAIISEVLDQWVDIVESANDHELHWSENLVPSWTSTLRSRTWLTQTVLDIVDQSFSKCANKIAVVVPFSEIIDLGFDDASGEEDPGEDEEEVVEVEASLAPDAISNLNGKMKAKGPQMASSRPTDLPIFEPYRHRLNEPICHRCIKRAVPRICFSEKSVGGRCQRCIHLKQSCSLTKKVVVQPDVVAESGGGLGRSKRKAMDDVEIRKVRQRLSGSGSRVVDGSAMGHSTEDAPRAGPSSYRRKASALVSEADKLRNDLRILIGGVAMVGKMLNKHIAELEALSKRRFGDELEGEMEFED